jgi:hypothetical protein
MMPRDYRGSLGPRSAWRTLRVRVQHACGHSVIHGIPENYPRERLAADFDGIEERPCPRCAGETPEVPCLP